MSAVKRLLFVCVENANRSQMAEAFARLLGGSLVEAYSAGSRPSGVVNPKAVDAMRELEYDLSAHGSKSLADLPEVEFDFVATMGCGDACPLVRAKRREDWVIPDPKRLPPDEFRAVRDLIRDKMQAALTELGVLECREQRLIVIWPLKSSAGTPSRRAIERPTILLLGVILGGPCLCR